MLSHGNVLLEDDLKGRFLSSPVPSVASDASLKSIRILDDGKRKTRKTINKKPPRCTQDGRAIRPGELNERMYQPTYQLEPKRKIDMERVRLVIKTCVRPCVDSNELNEYDSKQAMRLCDSLSNDIQFRVKMLKYDRYRIIVLASIVQSQMQGINWKMAFLWEKEFDQWTTYEYKTKTCVLNVTVLCVYCE